MVTESSTFDPQLAQQSEGPRELPLRVWPMVATQVAHLFSGSSLAFLGGSLGTHHVLLACSPPSPHPRPWRPLNSAKNRLKATPCGAENGGVYLAWASSPRSLLRRACGRAEGGLQDPGVRRWDL